MSLSALGRGNALRRARNAALAALLAAALVVNYSLFLVLLPPLLALLLLPPFVGTLAALCAALALTDTRALWEAARATPWAPTPASDLLDLFERVESRGRVLLELGSGDGRNLLLARKSAGFSTAIGLEYSPALVAISRLRIWWESVDGAVVHRADLLTAELPAAVDVVYLYLSVEALDALAPRLACAYGLGPRAVVVLSRDFELPSWGEPSELLTRGRTRLLAYDARAVRSAASRTTCEKTKTESVDESG